MAGDYIITGGRPLNGTVRVPAAKNSVLPLLAASLLCSGPVRLCGVPELADVAESLALLRSAGCTAERQGADVRVDGVPGSGTLAAGPAGRMRASILFCAPLLARLGRAQTVLPGGCRIGARPIDLHLAGLVQMGACPQLEGERLLLTAPAGLHGADITLRFPSVGATETLLLAAAAVGLCKLLSQVLILYGRRRFAVLMLLTFFLSLALDAAGLLPFSPIGILMPGIIAREFDRQGFRDSLLAMAVTTGLTALALLLVGGALAGL